MVALLGLFEHDEIGVEFGLRGERRAVDALQHRVVLVAAPVRAGDVRQLQTADRAGRVGVAAAAQVGELADRVQRDRVALFDVAGDDLGLVWVVLIALERDLARHPLAGHRIVGRDDLVHARFEAYQVLGRERLRPVEIVEEAGLDGGADRGLGFREDVLDGIGQHVRGGVAQRVEGGGVVVGMGRRGEHAYGFGRFAGARLVVTFGTMAPSWLA